MSRPNNPASPAPPGAKAPSAPKAPASASAPLGTIALITDERLSRERSSMLFRVVAILSTFAKVEIISGSLSEENVLKQIEIKNCGLVLAPWYHYLQWTRIEAFYGLSRTSGPTFAGYHAEPLSAADIAGASVSIRGILIDLGPSSSKAEIHRIVRALLVEKWRSGIRPLLEPQCPIYTENWTNAHSIGRVFDTVFAIPELQSSDWLKRSSSIRAALLGLWNLVFPDGQAQGLPGSVRAHFMAGVDRHAFCLRLCYSIPTCTPKTALNLFWPRVPNEKAALGFAPAREMLARNCDLVRAHTIAGTQDIEVLVTFFNRAEAEPREVGNVHHLWIEPISGETIIEIPNEPADGVHPFPKLPGQADAPAAAVTMADQHSEAELQDAKDRFIVEATAKVRKLQQILEDRELLLRELRSGGVGVSSPLPPPDADSLIDALWERILECEHRLFLFHDELQDLRDQRRPPEKLESLQQRIERMNLSLREWEEKIVAILKHLRKEKSRGESAA